MIMWSHKINKKIKNRNKKQQKKNHTLEEHLSGVQTPEQSIVLALNAQNGSILALNAQNKHGSGVQRQKWQQRGVERPKWAPTWC